MYVRVREREEEREIGVKCGCGWQTQGCQDQDGAGAYGFDTRAVLLKRMLVQLTGLCVSIDPEYHKAQKKKTPKHPLYTASVSPLSTASYP